MKRILLLLFVLLLLLAGFGAWIFFGSTTGFKGKSEFLYIRSDAATREAVMDSLIKNNIITNDWAFERVTGQLGYWNAIKPGKYEIKQGMSVVSIARMLKNGRQSTVDITINKFRTKEDLARALGLKFESDSAKFMAFFSSSDSLRPFGVEPETVMWKVFPVSYQCYWNNSPSEVYRKMVAASDAFWTADRKAKAEAIGLSPLQATTLASIVEEETTKDEEKDTIASVYLNRLKQGWPLQADPTLKFAVRNFALKEIGGTILNTESPYNTYRNKGLPPAPICTPSKVTVDNVLNPADTEYMFFVANLNLNGHRFSRTLNEHANKANEYRDKYGVNAGGSGK